VAAISFVVTLIKVGQAAEKELRLAVHQKTSIVNMLPEGTRRKIEGLDPEKARLRAVCGMRWFGGRVPNTQNTLTNLAADPDTFPMVYEDADLTAEEVEAWRKDRQAAVVGLGPAETYGWKPGSRVTLESTVPPYLSLEFHIVKVMPRTEKANFFYFRRDYLQEALKTAKVDRYADCNIFWVKCNSANDLRALQQDVDALFANSPDETKSEDENAFGANFTQAAGNIPGLMQAMAIVVVIIVALVAGNTMMMSFRERSRELGVFKAIGFQSGRIFTIVLSESLMLAVLGSLMGIVPTALFLWWFPLRGLSFGPISSVAVSWAAVVVSFVIAIAVGLAAGLWPAIQALRLRTVDALRRVN
jgi:putative ABC transport system permease protein